MPRFMCLTSKHYTANGEFVKKGQIIDDTRSLDTLFPNKFRRLNPNDPFDLPMMAQDVPIRNRTKVLGQLTNKDEVLKDDGIHVPNEKGKLIPKGEHEITDDDFESDEDDGGEEDDGEEENTAPDYGQKMKSQPPLAKKHGLSVFSNEAGQFFVFDDDRPDEPIAKNLADKDSVNKYLKDFAKSEK